MNIHELAVSYGSAWAAHDPDQVVALHADDTVFHIHDGTTPPAEGRDAVRDMVATLFESIPDLAFDIGRIYAADDHLVLEYEMHGTTGGAAFRVDGVDVISIRAGQVVRKDTYLDSAGFLHQVAGGSRTPGNPHGGPEAAPTAAGLDHAIVVPPATAGA